MIYNFYKLPDSKPVYDEHTLLLIHGEEITDSSIYEVPLSNHGVAIATDKSKFGGKSLYFDGNSRILFPYSLIKFGNSDFTIDWWEYCEAGAQSRFSVSWEDWGGLIIGYDENQLYAGTTLNLWDLINAAIMITPNVGTWTHWAFVRYNNVLKSYQNGIEFASAPLNGSIWDSTPYNAVIGNDSIQHNGSYKGYIDEFRISNVARWTSNFTPPAEPYSNIAPDYTMLLLHGEEIEDSSKNSIPLTNYGVTVSSAQSKFGGKSLYFDGSSKILFPYSLIKFGNSDFTIDWWEYCEADSKARFATAWEDWGGLLLGLDGNQIYAGSEKNNWNMINTPDNIMLSVTPNEWIHWAVVRYDNKLITYKNGIKFAEKTAMNNSIWNGNLNASIGAVQTITNDNYFHGYMDEFHISNNAQWTANFIPPSKPYPSNKPKYDIHTMLLLHGEEIKDSSRRNIALTNHGVTVSSAQSKFGGKSLYFDGNNSYISFPQNSIIYGTNDFTFDWWEYPLKANGTRFNSSQFSTVGNTNTTQRGLIVDSSGGSFTLSNNGQNDIISINNAYRQNILNTWTHWATVRHNGVVTTYKNGIQFKQFNANISVYQNTNLSQGIGIQRTDASATNMSFKGYIDEFRISDTARWTSNFTPPTEPYHS